MTKRGTKAKPAAMPARVRAAMKWLSARGARKGGKARWKGISQADRATYARKMVEARERKRAKRPKKL